MEDVLLDKSRDAHVDQFQSLADKCLKDWKTIVATRPRHSGGGLDDDTLLRFGELFTRMVESQARVNTMLSEAISELERDN